MSPTLKVESCRGSKALIESGNDKMQRHAVSTREARGCSVLFPQAVILYYKIKLKTRMHSSRMRTARSSSCRPRGGSALVNAGIHTSLGVGLETPLGVGLETPPRYGPGDPPQVWAWRPPWVWAWRPPETCCKACWDTTPETCCKACWNTTCIYSYVIPTHGVYQVSSSKHSCTKTFIAGPKRAAATIFVTNYFLF